MTWGWSYVLFNTLEWISGACWMYSATRAHALLSNSFGKFSVFSLFYECEIKHQKNKWPATGNWLLYPPQNSSRQATNTDNTLWKSETNFLQDWRQNKRNTFCYSLWHSRLSRRKIWSLISRNAKPSSYKKGTASYTETLAVSIKLMVSHLPIHLCITRLSFP